MKIAVEFCLGHKIQGLKNMKESYRPGIFDKSLPSEIVTAYDEGAFSMARKMAAEEGILVGMSGGAAVFAALERAKELSSGCIVVILPDSGERYLSTTLFASQERSGSGTSLRLFNTMSRKKEVFKPLNPGKATMYACGPTAFTPPNLAHCRDFMVGAVNDAQVDIRIGVRSEHPLNEGARAIEGGERIRIASLDRKSVV